MEQDRRPPQDPPDLRDQAEATFKLMAPRLEAMSAEALRAFIFELHLALTTHIETKHRLEHLLAFSPAVIYAREPRGNFAVTYISDNIRTLTGWKPRELLEDPQFWLNHIHPEDQPRISERLNLPWREDYQIQEYRFLARDNNYHWIRDEFKMIRDRDNSPQEIAGALVDVTECKAVEAQLMQAQRLEALGRLTGAVAHDFNNLLMAIMGYGELMRTSLFQDDPVYQYVKDILNAADRASSLTQQLLAFCRQQKMAPQVVDLNRLVEDLHKMLQRLMGEHIDLDIIPDPQLGVVKADPGQVGQIILNLALNARDAMATGGQLTLKTANIEFPQGHHCRLEKVPPGRYVALTLRDNGCGIDAAGLDFISEPRVTRQEARKGMGPGLAVVLEMVKQNHGHIDVESSHGEGTIFRVYLPRFEAEPEPTGERLPLREKLEGSETILLVEDDEALRTLLSRFFRLYGYKVLEACNGREAFETGGRHQGPIHIMLTDVVMPRMSGRELAERLAPVHPEMRVFYMSGYPDSDLAPYGVLGRGKTVIYKPFKPIDLVQRVRAYLDNPAEERDNQV
jgi:two-component system, cell cycle sensor histidine kinase and response regulator CckA